MKEIIGIRFRDGGKVYSFDPVDFNPKANDKVVVETARGAELGTVAEERHGVSEEKLIAPLRRVLRIATEADIKTAAELREKEKAAERKAAEKEAEKARKAAEKAAEKEARKAQKVQEVEEAKKIEEAERAAQVEAETKKAA